MKRHPVSGTYARALRDIAVERGKIDEIAGELVALDQALSGDRALQVFFESPKIPRNEKKSVLEKTLAMIGGDENPRFCQNFLGVESVEKLVHSFVEAEKLLVVGARCPIAVVQFRILRAVGEGMPEGSPRVPTG